jgi:hypothetical protein
VAENVMTFLPPGAGMNSAATMGGFGSYSEMGLMAPSSVGGGASAAAPGGGGRAPASTMEKWGTLLWALAFYAAGIILLHMT